MKKIIKEEIKTKEKGTSKVNSQEYFMREAITVRHPEGRTKQSFVDKIRKIFRRK